MAQDSWTFRPLKDGTVEIKIVKWNGKSLGTILKPDEAGSLFAGISAALRAAHALSRRPPAPDRFEGTIPPVTPDGLGLLHPSANKRHLVMLIGEAHVVIDISDLETEQLARSLLMASAGDQNPQ